MKLDNVNRPNLATFYENCMIWLQKFSFRQGFPHFLYKIFSVSDCALFSEFDPDSALEIIRKSLACILASSTADKSGLVAFDPIMAAGFDFEMQRERSAGCHPFLLQSRYAFPTD